MGHRWVWAVVLLSLLILQISSFGVTTKLGYAQEQGQLTITVIHLDDTPASISEFTNLGRSFSGGLPEQGAFSLFNVEGIMIKEDYTTNRFQNHKIILDSGQYEARVNGGGKVFSSGTFTITDNSLIEVQIRIDVGSMSLTVVHLDGTLASPEEFGVPAPLHPNSGFFKLLDATGKSIALFPTTNLNIGAKVILNSGEYEARIFTGNIELSTDIFTVSDNSLSSMLIKINVGSMSLTVIHLDGSLASSNEFGLPAPLQLNFGLFQMFDATGKPIATFSTTNLSPNFKVILNSGEYEARTNRASDGQVLSCSFTIIDNFLTAAKLVIENGECRDTFPPMVKQPSTIDISIDSSSIELGQGVIVSSSISPFHFAQVTLTYTKPDLTSEVRQAAFTDSGAYIDMFVPDVLGQWSVQASWEGDEDHLGATSTLVDFSVVSVERKLEIEVNQLTTSKRSNVYFEFHVNMGTTQENPFKAPISGHEIRTKAGQEFVGPIYVTANNLVFPVSITINAFNKNNKLLGSTSLSIEQISELPLSFSNNDKKKIDFRGSVRALDALPLEIPEQQPTSDCELIQDSLQPICSVSVLDQWNWFQVNADKVWQQYSDGILELDPVIVAVLDSGIDCNQQDLNDCHEDLKANIWTNDGEIPNNNKDDDKNGYKDDYYGVDCIKNTLSGLCKNDKDGPLDNNGHGTQVVGVIAAEIDNGQGIAGIAPNAKIMAVKVSNAKGQATPDDLARGINYAVNMGAKVINISLAAYEPVDDSAVNKAIKRAYEMGVTVVVGAGNDLTSDKPIPASYERVIAVSALSRFDISAKNLIGDILYFKDEDSNYGSYIDVSAPGKDIWTTCRPTLPPCDNGYMLSGQTSIAAPHVSAGASLIQGYYHHKTGNYLTPQQVRDIIFKSSLDLGSPSWDPYYGNGALDLLNALEEANALI